MTPVDFIARLALPTHFPCFFPDTLEQYRLSVAAASGTPDEFAAAYMLAAAGTSVGANVTARVQQNWTTRANMYLMVVGPKGMGKSTLAQQVFGPLRAHEEILKEEAEAARALSDEDEEEEDDEDDGSRGRRRSHTAEPCVIINDVTGPALIRVLERNGRQLLVNTDEMSVLFKQRSGDRQLWCELYDGKPRTSARATDGSQPRSLPAPYVSLLGTIQPDLLSCAYNKRGDDGMLDRVLIVGEPTVTQPDWPEDTDNRELHDHWATAIDRLFHVEQLAANATRGQVASLFRPEAIQVFKTFQGQINEVILCLGLPPAQYGVVNKIRAHAVRLALLHRVLRWAACEFGDRGPLGDIDEQDARAACDAAAFFFGRWIIWRPELHPRDTELSLSFTLAGDPSGDPAMLDLLSLAIETQAGLQNIERVIRHLRGREPGPVAISSLSAAGPLVNIVPQNIRDACSLLVSRGCAEWVDDKSAILLHPLPRRHARSRSCGSRSVVVS
jgi:energy-coupling factor transporter ATP-binding protein EcfA2